MAEGARRRICFVPPRYGADVIGGSEALSRETAHGLARRGWDVEVLTTCARDHFTWRNAYPPGTEMVDGVTVRRFPTVHPRKRRERDSRTDIERRIQLGEAVSLDEQLEWVSGTFRVPDLFHHLLARADEFDAIVLSPYLFWTTVACAAIAPAKTIVMPCLHDEPYARLELFRPVLAEAASVWFLSEPEHELAHRLGGLAVTHDVTGCGIQVPTGYDPDGFRARHRLERPFVLFAGRREGGKGWHQLVEAFSRAVHQHGLDLDLVTMGVGPVEPPPHIAGRIVDLGFLGLDEHADAFAAAAAYMQPSRFESFSRTIMEAWLAGTPVIANGQSEVVRWHCERSGAGLTYQDDIELGECLAFVAEAPDAAQALAGPGRDYVLDTYTPDAVLDRMELSLERLGCVSS